MKKVILSINGMTCSACSNGLEKYLNKQKGIEDATVNLVMASASITYDETVLDLEKIEKFVKEAGFKSKGIFKNIDSKKVSKKEKNIFILFTVLAIILMYISMGHMVGLKSIYFLDPYTHPVNYTFALLILASIFVIYGLDIIKNGYKNLIHKTPNMDTLVAIGVITSYIYSIYNMVHLLKGDIAFVHNLYFESSAIVIYFIKLGRYIDSVSKDKTKEAIAKLALITPQDATILRSGKEVKVTLDEIKKKDIVVCKAGEKIAVDGIVTKGKTHVDESFITGESKPVEKSVGANVIAGSLNYDGYIEYSAEKIGRDSTVSGIVKMVVEATNTKAPIARLADVISSYFVPAVILIAVITFLGYMLLGFPFGDSIIRFVTILVVACPCSLGLATPLAVIVSEGICASHGILIKKSEILEETSKVTKVVMDKTGTLTYGKLKIEKINIYNGMEEEKLMQLVGSIESKSTHPIAKAFVDYLEENKIEKIKVDNVDNVSGFGLEAKVNSSLVLLGNSKMLEKHNIENSYEKDEINLATNGCSVIYVTVDGKIIALIGVNDVVRKEAKSVVKKLAKENIEVIMLTGDNEKTANKIAKEIGIKNVISNVMPKDKLEVIEKLKKQNEVVMMCGDGINDSPSLAKADVGVSIKSATDIAMDSSSVILIGDNLNGICNLINISKHTIKNIKQNLFWAFFYNALMIPVAMGLFTKINIEINPSVASIAMVLSSLTVILNTLRLKKIKID